MTERTKNPRSLCVDFILWLRRVPAALLCKLNKVWLIKGYRHVPYNCILMSQVSQWKWVQILFEKTLPQTALKIFEVFKMFGRLWPGWSGWGSPIYKPHRSVPRDRVWFLKYSVLALGIRFGTVIPGSHFQSKSI